MDRSHACNNTTTVQTLSANTVRVKIYNQFCVALIDTGCGTSVMSERLARRLKLKVDRLQVGDNSILVAADGKPMHVRGKTQASIKLGGLTVPFEFLVLEELNQNLILGIDFLKDTKAVINCSDRTISFYDDMIELNLVDSKKKVVAFVNRQYKLQPRTETIVQVDFSEPLPQNCYVMEPLISREGQKFLVARTVTESNGRKSVCKILNPTNQILTLRRRLPIASIEVVEVNSITVYEDTGQTSTETQYEHTNVNTEATNNTYTDRNVNKECRSLKELGIKIVFMGFGLDNDNLHSPNEKYNIENYFKGIETIPYFHKYFAAPQAPERGL